MRTLAAASLFLVVASIRTASAGELPSECHNSDGTVATTFSVGAASAATPIEIEPMIPRLFDSLGACRPQFTDIAAFRAAVLDANSAWKEQTHLTMPGPWQLPPYAETAPATVNVKTASRPPQKSLWRLPGMQYFN